MINTTSMVISKQDFPEIFDFADKNSALAKNLYNAALFRIRQVFTGWSKDTRTDNELEVFEEIRKTSEVYKSFKISHILRPNALEKILRANNNPDFFAGLPMQTAQAVVRRACGDFSNWLKSLKAYKKDPSGFTGKPKMPGYKKSDHITFTVSNQDAVLYDDESPRKNKSTKPACMLKLPGLPRGHRFPLKGLAANADLREVSFRPYYGKYVMIFTIQDMASFFHPDLPGFAGIDFGTDNIAAIVYTDSTSAVYKGGAVMSENRLFAKNKAEAVSIITKGHEKMHATSKRLDRLSMHHDCFIKDQMHKISHDIVVSCVKHGVGTLVIGVNKQWKQNASIGKKNNQNFVSIPHATLRQMIEYKAMSAGITVIEQEESYTSKADVTVKDELPVYGKERSVPVFSGERVERGLYCCKSGMIINADCNGAANILRKAFPDIWDKTKDFSFLAMPESVGFKAFTPKYRL